MRFSEPWPRSGMMRNGTAYQLAPLARLTDATACGLLPTPRATDGDKGTRTAEGAAKEFARGRNIDLGMVVKLWPTPTVQDAANNGGPSQYERNSLPLNAAVGGALNPTWVEWLMGFPTGHTDLNPSETP